MFLINEIAFFIIILLTIYTSRDFLVFLIAALLLVPLISIIIITIKKRIKVNF